MKNFILHLLLTVSCLICSLSFQYCYFITPLNSNEVKDNISYLSSDSFKGRLAGTLENYEAVNFIKNYFESQHLTPYKSNYLEGFNVLYPRRIAGTPYLRVLDKNGFIIKQYNYGVDYKEDMLNFKDNNISFKKADILMERGNNFQIHKDNKYFIFYNPEDDNLNFRSSFIANSSQNMYIMIKRQTAQDIKKYVDSGCEISCFIPFENKSTSIYNIIGYIKGKKPNLPPLVLSAHFDHLGTDLSGKVYSGSLDNASGTSFLLGLVKYINSLGRPDRNIIIASFNAEEFGCLGSKEFVQKYSNDLKGSKVINFDMIGSNKKIPLTIMGGKWDTKNSNFINEIANLCRKNKVDFKYTFENCSDHEYFRTYNIDAVTLSDEDMSKIHTPEDKDRYINTQSIDRCFNIVSKEIKNYAFKDNFYVLYCRNLFILSLISLLIISKLCISRSF
ncbi:M28 family metallopeptidase [Clostridium sp. Mt-5]|uniref:M28 family metallopeptidase n=1 Tax=Clostridium moutaii TaxID=3240932 RepID=A0ABV4BKF7_9CLOT